MVLQISNKNGILNIFVKFTEKHLRCSLDYIEKESSKQMFSCKFCEIFQNTYFIGHLRTAASNALRLVYCTESFSWK